MLVAVLSNTALWVSVGVAGLLTIGWLVTRNRKMRRTLVELTQENAYLVQDLKAEQDLLQSTQKLLDRFQFLASHSDNFVLLTDPDLNILWISQGVTRVSGFIFPELEKMPITELVDLSKEEFLGLVGLESMYHPAREVGLQTKDGEEYWLSLNPKPMIGKSGKVRSYLVTALVITERRANADMLENLSMAAHAANSRVAVLDAYGQVLWANRAFLSHFGFASVDSFVASHGDNWLVYSKSPDVEDVFQAVLDSKEPGMYRELSPNTATDQHSTDLWLTPMLDGAGRVKKVLAINADG